MLSVQSFKVTLDSSKSAFIVAFLDQEYHFDYINKLLFTTKSILNLKLSHFLRLKAIREESNAFERLFTTEERGLAKIIEGTVFLSNAKAHDLLETDMEMLPYEILQSRFQTEKTIYLDRLISKTVWTLPLSTFKEKIRQMEIRVFVDEFTTYLSFRDITEESHKNEDLKLKSEKTAIYDLKNMHRFRADFQDLKAQTALFCMKIANISVLEKKYLHSDVETLNRLCHSSFKVAAGSHVLDCYLDENGFFLAIFLTVDKRIIDRIFNEFTRRFHEVCPSVMPSFDLPDIRGSVINVVKNRSLEQNLDQLYKVIYRTTKDIPLLYFDKNMSLLESQNEAVNFQLDAMLAVDNPILEYRQVGNLETRKVEMYRGWLADNILPFPSEMVLAAACSTRKSVQLEMMIFRQSIKDVLAFCQVTDVEVGFIISFGDETLQEPQRIDEIVRLAKRTKVPPHKMVILYRTSGNEVDSLSVHNLRFLKEKGFRIGLENVLNLLKFGQKDCLEGMDFLFIQADELLASSHSLFLFLEEAGVGKIVASGVNEEEKTKASLQLKIPRIEGNVLPNRFKIEELIKKLEKH
jgi:hypothetical protein